MKHVTAYIVPVDDGALSIDVTSLEDETFQAEVSRLPGMPANDDHEAMPIAESSPPRVFTNADLAKLIEEMKAAIEETVGHSVRLIEKGPR